MEGNGKANREEGDGYERKEVKAVRENGKGGNGQKWEGTQLPHRHDANIIQSNCDY